MLESLTGFQRSPGQVATQWGFGFHQSVTGSSLLDNPTVPRTTAVLTANTRPKPGDGDSFAAVTFLLRVDRGDGEVIYKVVLPGGAHADREAVLRQALITAANNLPGGNFNIPGGDAAELEAQTGLKVRSTIGVHSKLEIQATADGTLDRSGNTKKATIHMTVNTPNTVAAGKGSFNHVEKLTLGSGGNHFVFGNDYWGASTAASVTNTIAQSVPLVNVIARNLQGKLTIDTQAAHEQGSPLELDFRAVNRELRFSFGRAKNMDGSIAQDAVDLTVTRVRDDEVPLVGLGREVRDRKLVFTHLDKRTILRGGRYKNTFNFDFGATFAGNLKGGEGHGIVGTFGGRALDNLLDLASLAEDVGFNLSGESLSAAQYQVENTLSYANATGATGVKVNLQAIKEASQGKLGKWTRRGQTALGNVMGPLLDEAFTGTTGLSGLSENTTDAALGDVIVRSGFNIVRGTDYSLADQGTGDLFAFLTSGADTISIGDNAASITPGVHILAGGSGADTYAFNTQYWGLAVIIDNLWKVDISAGEVGDAIFDAIVPQDTLDFSKVFGDLFFTVFEISSNDIPLLRRLGEDIGIPAGIPLEVGTSMVVVTTVDPGENVFDPLGGGFSLGGLLEVGRNLQMAVAVGVENISGGRGLNKVNFIGDARLGGRIAPGYGGTLETD
ncbi:MAG: hypothetical protein GY716_00010 [bacterium]|nr:hypothetical protein [bacterium]